MGMPINQALQYLRRIEESLQAFANVHEVLEAAAGLEGTVAALEQRQGELTTEISTKEAKVAELKESAERFARDDAATRAQLVADRQKISEENKALRATEAKTTTDAIEAMQAELTAKHTEHDAAMTRLADERSAAEKQTAEIREGLAKLKGAIPS